MSCVTGRDTSQFFLLPITLNSCSSFANFFFALKFYRRERLHFAIRECSGSVNRSIGSVNKITQFIKNKFLWKHFLCSQFKETLNAIELNKNHFYLN